MNKYEVTTTNKMNQVLESALQLFVEHGFKNVTMKDIATASSVSQASIYNYFGSKEDIVTRIIERWMLALDNDIDTILEKNVSLSHKIDQALQLCDTQLSLELSTVMENTNDERFIELLGRGIKINKRSVYKKIIESGKLSKELNPDIPTNTYVEFIDAMNNVELDDEVDLAHIKSLLLNGILGS